MKTSLKIPASSRGPSLFESVDAGTGTPADASSPKIYSVSEIVRDANLLLQHSYGTVWVEGEISGFRVYPSGHGYFTLKDAGASLSGIIYRTRLARLKFEPQDGMQVLYAGALGIYESRGQSPARSPHPARGPG